MIKREIVSVIVPVYNVELYLEKCIQSILNQTYNALEIIIVNDGATDLSEEICMKYAQQDSRIILINQKNAGLSAARNSGIRNASGKYIMYIDSDDWIDNDCIEKCIKEIQKDENLDIVLFPYIKEYKQKKVVVKLFDLDTLYFNQEQTKEFLLKSLFGPTNSINPLKIDNLSTAWGKLYRRSILNEVEFTDTKKISVEDSYYNVQVFYHAKCCKYISNTFYHYRKTNPISLTKNYNLEKAYLRENMYAVKREFVTDKGLGEEFENALNNRVIINLFAIIYGLVCSNISYKTKVKYCKEVLNREIYKKAFKQFSLDELEFKWKCFYWLCRQKKHTIIIFVLNSLILIKRRGVYSEK
ncbi:glycosyltransferase family A protein [Niameybacter massiliensis]|uniref:Glycosyltransferase family A protein n=1 Tax=Holtiella tumoricola TaxID=3018743 RepID=A0AA42J238_9FIRM|nr:glycosyltransferase family A protein [Holtiella tumoricola]MDA3733172.1 glycosyltransferase family A protein [Holtiella tumoricola]